MNDRITVQKRIAIGSDHVGYPMKEEIKKYLEELGYAYQDFGAHSAERTDYPLFAKDVTSAISSGGADLGIAVGNILGVISPQRVIFGGGVSLAGDLLLEPIIQTVKERVHVIPLQKVEFVMAELGINGGLVGAALWAKRRCEGR